MTTHSRRGGKKGVFFLLSHKIIFMTFFIEKKKDKLKKGGFIVGTSLSMKDTTHLINNGFIHR